MALGWFTAGEDWGLIVRNKRIILASEFMSELGLELRHYWAVFSIASVSFKEGVVLRKTSKNPILWQIHSLFFPRQVLRCLPTNECGFLCSHNGVAPSWPTQSSYRIPPGRCKDKFGGDAGQGALCKRWLFWFRGFRGDSKVWGALTKRLTGYH